MRILRCVCQEAAISPQNQEFAASAEDPMKLARSKGSNIVSEAGICCLCRRPNETCQDQRQQMLLSSRILLLPPKTRRNLPRSKAANAPQKQDFAASAKDPKNVPRSKAAISPRKQDFAASAEDPKKLTKIKGSKRSSEAGFCCLCRRPEETHQVQMQQTRLGSRILLPLPKNR